jgi:hypothetical protein
VKKLTTGLLAAAALAIGTLAGAQTTPPAPSDLAAAQEKAMKLTATQPGETVITFEKYDIGKPVPTVTEKDVTFELAWKLQRSQAVPRVMFFPHLNPKNAGNAAADPKGILNAMAEEQGIPIKITFPSPVTSVTLVMWGSTDVPVLVEAHGKDDKLIDSAALASAPNRKSPADPNPTFELTVKGDNIAYVLFGGGRRGEFLAAEQVRFKPQSATSAPATQK